MIMTWAFSLAACETEQQPSARLHHWFIEDSSRVLYNSLYNITGCLAVRTAQTLVNNSGLFEEAQTAETDLVLPFSGAFQRSIPKFRECIQSLQRMYWSLPNYDLSKPHEPAALMSPSYISSTEAHMAEFRVGELMPRLKEMSNLAQQENITVLNQEIADRNENAPLYFQDPMNTTSLEPMVIKEGKAWWNHTPLKFLAPAGPIAPVFILLVCMRSKNDMRPP